MGDWCGALETVSVSSMASNSPAAPGISFRGLGPYRYSHPNLGAQGCAPAGGFRSAGGAPTPTTTQAAAATPVPRAAPTPIPIPVLAAKVHPRKVTILEAPAVRGGLTTLTRSVRAIGMAALCRRFGDKRVVMAKGLELDEL